MIRHSQRSPCLFRTPFALQDLPVDILPPILVQLSDRKDLHACALVSKVFNRAATPLLYQTLDSRIISRSVVHHPATTLLQRPQYAQYVRHVTETGAIHRGALPRYAHITGDTLKALALCKNLESMTWVDDSSTTDSVLLSFLAVVRVHPLREISIRSHSDIGSAVWSELITLTGLRKISIWCMEGPPRVLQGWSELLGSTLTHLELGRCAGVPPTILISVLSQLPKLKDLRLKGAPAAAMPSILTCLPGLRSLDTEYPGAYYHRRPSARATTDGISPPPPFPALRELTVRTSSMDSDGPTNLWSWIRELVPKPGLETFKLHAFVNNRDMGYHTGIPRIFLLDLARVQKTSLKHFMVGDASLTLNGVAYLCSEFPNLETLVCSTASPNIKTIAETISSAKNLQTLRLDVQWIPNDPSVDDTNFTVQHAKNLMLRTEDSKLRAIAMGPTLYTGKWVLEEPKEEGQGGELRFQVMPDFTKDRWQT
ncbi:putative F-box-like [Lyophyllum shimeji]|uniref:F-box-like n=1 Tax=Lyophyllum shimeji TaxID=47721 RepID=A0A9P3PLW1_LYOSH|nr:putative F-box-like [Lyophyllum shimeji]